MEDWRFWRKEISQNLPFPMKLEEKKDISWFHTECTRTQGSYFKAKDFPKGKEEKKNRNEEIIRTRKIRLYPNSIQRKELLKWLGTTRYVYNKVLFTGRYKQISEYECHGEFVAGCKNSWKKRLLQLLDKER